MYICYYTWVPSTQGHEGTAGYLVMGKFKKGVQKVNG